MSFEIRFRVPENLNIDEIIEKNKPVFHKNGLKKEKLVFICDALVNSRAQHRKEINEKGNSFVPLSSEILQEVVHDYKKHLDFLLSNGILLTDNHFIEGEKCRWYCFNHPYAGQRLKEVKVYNYKLKQAIRRAAHKRNEKLKKALRGYNYLTKWWDEGKLEIDLKAAHLWIEKYKKEKIDSIENNPSIVDKNLAIENAIDTTEDFKYLALSIHTNNHKYSFSGEGHRFYNPISNLKRELRGFLSYDGQPLVDIDIKNSQPFLSTALFQSSFWKKQCRGKSQILTLEEISKEIFNKVSKEQYYKHIITLLKTSESLVNRESPFKKFIDLVKNGTFYEYIQEHFEPLYPTKFDTRGKVKVAVLTIFYIENYIAVHHKPSQTFKEHFPEVYELFRLIKGIQNNYLPIILQRIESFLVIDVVCKTLSKQHPQIPFFTIHDNVITTKGNEGIVRDIMSLEIEKWIGYKPQLAFEDLTPPIKEKEAETWVSILGYDGYYEVSSAGLVRSVERKVPYVKGVRTLKSKTLNGRINNRGYREVRLSKNGNTYTKLVHILTATAFVPNPESKPEVNHLDGDKLNNHYSNFEWTTHSENVLHAYRIGLIVKKSTPVIDICTGKRFPSVKKAAEFNNINYSTCKNQLSGKRKNPTCLRYSCSPAA